MYWEYNRLFTEARSLGLSVLNTIGSLPRPEVWVCIYWEQYIIHEGQGCGVVCTEYYRLHTQARGLGLYVLGTIDYTERPETWFCMHWKWVIEIIHRGQGSASVCTTYNIIYTETRGLGLYVLSAIDYTLCTEYYKLYTEARVLGLYVLSTIDYTVRPGIWFFKHRALEIVNWGKGDGSVCTAYNRLYTGGNRSGCSVRSPRDYTLKPRTLVCIY